MSKLRVGYILDDSDQSFFIWDSVNKAKLSESYSIEALIIQRSSLNESKSVAMKIFHYTKKRGIAKLFERVLFEIIRVFESFIVVTNPKFKEFLNKYPLERFQIPHILVSLNISPSGLVYQYDDESLETPEEIEDWIRRFREIEPIELTPEEEAAWQEDGKKQAAFDSSADRLRRISELFQ